MDAQEIYPFAALRHVLKICDETVHIGCFMTCEYL